MRSSRPLLYFLALVLAFGMAGCDRDSIVDPPAPVESPSVDSASSLDTDGLALALATTANWEIDPSVAPPSGELDRSPSLVTMIDRQEIVEGIAHYTFDIPLGSGPYEQIRLHRIVAERSEGRPIRAREALFMLHGGGVGFEGSYLAQESDPADRSLPVYLASNGIDVWGIDLGWTLVPAEETNLEFFADWGLEREIRDLEAGLAVARLTRVFTGSGFARMNLLSWSAGVIKTYVYAAQQADRPSAFRHVKTLIPVDGTAGLADSSEGCELVAALEAALEAGEIVDTTGILATTVSQLAQFDPDGFSPLPGFESFTNLQVLLLAQTLTDQALNGGTTPFHLFAGTFNSFGLPEGFRYVSNTTGIEFYGAWAPYFPNRVELESRQYECDAAANAVPADFAAIRLPVLFVAPGGGYGTGAVAITEAAFSSPDFRTLVVSTGVDPLFDLGHVDVFKAESARDLFWQPVLEWIEEFAEPGRRNRPFKGDAN